MVPGTGTRTGVGVNKRGLLSKPNTTSQQREKQHTKNAQKGVNIC